MPRAGDGIYRRGNLWWISWQDAAGQRHRESVGRSYADALIARAQRMAGVPIPGKASKGLTLSRFVDTHWHPEVAITFKPSTRRGYGWLLQQHLLPAFGEFPLRSITRAEVKRFIAVKSQQQRHSYSTKRPNPERPTLSPKTIKNAVGLLVSIMESAAVDYGLLGENPLRGMLRRRHFPTDAHRVVIGTPVLEPQDFVRAVRELRPPVLQAVLFAALTGLRWGEQVALRTEDVDLRRNRLSISRALYRRVSQTTKTRRSTRHVDLCPTVRYILKSVRRTGYVFSEDGQRPIGDGSWIKRQWHDAQIRTGITHPIRWHDLRHQFVSLLIAAGKHPKYISQQAGHASAGFTMDRYGHLFETVAITPVEWIDDLLDLRDVLLALDGAECDNQIGKAPGSIQNQAGEQKFDRTSQTPANKGPGQ